VHAVFYLQLVALWHQLQLRPRQTITRQLFGAQNRAGCINFGVNTGNKAFKKYLWFILKHFRFFLFLTEIKQREDYACNLKSKDL